MQPSQTKTLEASERVSLLVGNAAGVEISLNGKAVGPIGRHGQVRRVELTAESFRISSGSVTNYDPIAFRVPRKEMSSPEPFGALPEEV